MPERDVKGEKSRAVMPERDVKGVRSRAVIPEGDVDPRGRSRAVIPVCEVDPRFKPSKEKMELQRRTEEEKTIKDIIKRGKVSELKDTIQPWRLAKCKTNALLFSLETSAELRSLAKKKSSERHELVSLSKSVEEFACALLEPFEHDEELKSNFGKGAVDTVIETAVTCKKKKFLSNAVIYNFMIKKWYGHYFRLAKEKDCFLDFCLWFLLHLWSVADILLSPVVFLVLFTLDWSKRRLPRRRGHFHDHVPVTPGNDLELGKTPEFEMGSFDEQVGRQALGLFRKYIVYLRTPYFIFFKDALSYITLLGLHFTLCVSKSSIPFSIIELIILVFFAGRIVNEVFQFLLRKEEKMILQKGDEPRPWVKEQLRKYISDSWNVIDLSTITIYLITLLVRIVTWSADSGVVQNRVLMVAQYLYGLNAALITIRAFGHIMETNENTGTIQIALFRIVAGLGAIVGQFLAIILAFSLALTKLFVAEMSFNKKEMAQNSYCKSNGIQCWWQTLKQLIWSLFGMEDMSALNTADGTTKGIALVLYVVFLVLAVILLVNMMIALLSNTYDRVEDNSMNEWSYKKAITIMTYSSYHPIIVPMNLISLPIYLVYRKCQKNNTQAFRKPRREMYEADFNRIVREELEPLYWTKYGYSYPPRDEDKTNSILRETLGARRITSKIAEAVFSRPLEGVQFGSSAWDAKGVAVEGCRMWYTCDDATENENHGAIYHSELKPDYPKFEVLIQDFGERRILSIGLVYKDHNHHVPPGWHSKRTKTGTVGFHVDDGRIFSRTYIFGKEIPGSMAHRGDVVGCKLLFDRKTDRGSIPVVFSLNGNDLKIEGEQIEVEPNENGELPVYPFISMGYKGISVLFKLCACEERIRTTNESSAVKEKLEQLEQKIDFLMEHMHPKDE